jgi:hypothetical protein
MLAAGGRKTEMLQSIVHPPIYREKHYRLQYPVDILRADGYIENT